MQPLTSVFEDDDDQVEGFSESAQGDEATPAPAIEPSSPDVTATPTATEPDHYVLPRDEIAFKQKFRELVDSDPQFQSIARNFGSRKVQAQMAAMEREHKAKVAEYERRLNEMVVANHRTEVAGMDPETFGKRYRDDAQFRARHHAAIQAHEKVQEAATSATSQSVDPIVQSAHERITAMFDEAEDFLPSATVELLRKNYLSGALREYEPLDAVAEVSRAIALLRTQHSAAPARPAPTAQAAPSAPAPAQPERPAAPPARANPNITPRGPDLSARAAPPARNSTGVVSTSQWEQYTPDVMEATLKAWGVGSVSQAYALGLIT